MHHEGARVNQLPAALELEGKIGGLSAPGLRLGAPPAPGKVGLEIGVAKSVEESVEAGLGEGFLQELASHLLPLAALEPEGGLVLLPHEYEAHLVHLGALAGV